MNAFGAELFMGPNVSFAAVVLANSLKLLGSSYGSTCSTRCSMCSRTSAGTEKRARYQVLLQTHLG